MMRSSARPGTRRLRMQGFTLIEVTIVLIVVSLLAGVVWWAYGNHRRKMRAADARKNLDRIYESSLAYYLAPHASLDDKELPRQFPPSVAATPGVDACCHQPNHRCDPKDFADAWKADTWKSLDFSINEPFYHWYSYDSQGTGKNARFAAWAYGNLDCDDQFSTFMRAGHVDDNGQPVSSGPIEIKDEFE